VIRGDEFPCRSTLCLLAGLSHVPNVPRTAPSRRLSRQGREPPTGL
jgi:hypothetical protein